MNKITRSFTAGYNRGKQVGLGNNRIGLENFNQNIVSSIKQDRILIYLGFVLTIIVIGILIINVFY